MQLKFQRPEQCDRLIAIADNGVTAASLGDSAVTTAKINDLAVTAGKIAGGALAAPAAGVFEAAITVVDQIQQASASDLSANTYVHILIPAAA